MDLTAEEKERIKIQKLKEIEEKTILLMKSMEILHELINTQEKAIHGISEEIEHSVSKVKQGVEEVEDANEYSYIHYYLYTVFTMIGGGVLYWLM